MPAIPLLSGIVATGQAEFAQSYPLNLEPVALDNKISKGQLRATSGAVTVATGPGTDRGGILWKNVLYRVMGTELVSVAANGAIASIGDVGGSGPISIDIGFDRIGIRSGNQLWYYDGSALAQVTDVDLGPVIDAMWIGGYWMTTDGTSIIVTELSNPFSVQPLKYGSAEEDPDMVTGLIKLRNEAYVAGRNTIQVFRNIGGNGFPFQTQIGATIPYGCVSATAKCLFAGTFAFVGSARNEGLRVYVAGQGDATAISSRAIEDALAAVADQSAIVLEARAYREEQRLFVHLPDESWVYCAEASAKVEEKVWYRIQSAGGPYRIRNAVQAYGKTFVGDASSSALGLLSDDTDLHFGDEPGWQFDAGLIYNEGQGGIVHSVELIGLPGRASREATIFFSMTKDGQTFGNERQLSAGKPGERARRLQWRPHAMFSNYLGLRFRGTGGMPGFARLEAEIEPLGA